MMIGSVFEFRIFEGEDATERPSQFHRLRGDSAARSKAGTLAKQFDGPIDVAYAGNAPWEDRYITTAMPSTFHKNGVQFEKLT